jgi:hypothetical protein
MNKIKGKRWTIATPNLIEQNPIYNRENDIFSKGLEQNPKKYDTINLFSETIEMLKYFTAFPDEDFEEDMDKHISFTMTVDARKIKEAKQLIKEATELNSETN